MLPAPIQLHTFLVFPFSWIMVPHKFFLLPGHYLQSVSDDLQDPKTIDMFAVLW